MGDKWNFKGDKLYDDGRVRIHVSERFPDEHDVVINDNYIYLSRGIMEEWAGADPNRIASGYLAMRSVHYEMEHPGVPINEFGWALAKARIVEVQKRSDLFMREARESKDKYDGLISRLDEARKENELWDVNEEHGFSEA